MSQTMPREDRVAVSVAGVKDSTWSSERVAWCLIAVGALFRIVSILVSDNAGGDAGAHVGQTAEWLSHPSVKFVFWTYPPGHFWLIGLFSLLVRDVVWAGRLLSLVCGIASLYVVWKLVRLAFGVSAGLLSLAVFSFYSLHIGYSATSSAEVPYLFFLLVGTYCFLAGISAFEGQFRLLLSSGISFSVAESIRFEAWIFLFGLAAAAGGVWLWQRRLPNVALTALAAWMVAAGAWPLFMMIYCRHTYGDAMYLVTQNHLRVVQALETTSMAHQLSVMPVALLLSVSPIAVLAALAGLALSLSSSASSILALATLFFAGVEAFEIVHGGLLATARYTITLGTLLCLASGCGFDWFIQRWLPVRAKLAHRLIFSLLFLNCIVLAAISFGSGRLADEIASISPRLRYPQHISEVAQYLRGHMRTGDAVVFDDYNVESNILADSAGIPVPPGRRAYLASKINHVSLWDYLDHEHPRFLVYAERGTLRETLNLGPGCDGVQQVGQTEFRCTFASQVYRVYELSYR